MHRGSGRSDYTAMPITIPLTMTWLNRPFWDPHLDPPWGPPPGGPPQVPGGPGGGGAPGGPPGPPPGPPKTPFSVFWPFCLSPIRKGQKHRFLAFSAFWGFFCAYLTCHFADYSRRRLKMAIFGFGGYFGGSPRDPQKPPKTPNFANFRWVLNNSPSRDIIRALFWDILGHLELGHFGGPPFWDILGLYRSELYRIGWYMVGLGGVIIRLCRSSCHHHGYW